MKTLLAVRQITALIGGTTLSNLLFAPSTLAAPVQLLSQTPIAPENIPGNITISRFKIIGDPVIPQAEIDRVLQPYLFQPISFIELLEAQQALTQLYINRGYVTSGAYIPPQTIRDRTVKIKIIPGKIEKIEISGLKKLSPEYIRSRIAIAAKPPLNQDRLLNALQLLQLDPLIANISAELSQGLNPGTSLLKLEVEEADTSRRDFQVNNYSSLSIGSVRYQVSLTENNLLGYGDRLNVSYINTEGSDSLENVSYVVPIGAYNSKIRLATNLNNSEIIAEPFVNLDLESQSRYYEITYLQPVLQTPNQDLTLGFGFSHQNSQISLMDVGFPSLARGANAAGETKISALRLFQEYSDRSQDRVFALRSQFSIGIDAFDATINNNELPDSKFLIWRGQAQYLQKLTSRTNLLLRSDLQIADRPLVSLEQFSAGGAVSVRGYNEERILGDNGIFLSLELANTVLEIPQWNSGLELIPFVDFGRVWNNDDLQLETNTLASMGIGLQFTDSEKFSARIDWGIPLIDDNLAGDSLQEQGVHFSFFFF